MSKSDAQTRDRILQIHQEALTEALKEGKKAPSAADIAKLAGVTKDTAQKVIRRYSEYTDIDSPSRVEKIDLPSPLISENDNRIIVADVHVPAVDWELATVILETGRKHKIRELDLVGDLFCQDMFSRHPKIVMGPSFRDERGEARRIISFWMQQFNLIRFCRGNHDERVLNAMDAQITMEELRDLVAPDGKRHQIQPSVHIKMYVNSPNTGMWCLMHQREYSKYPLRVACDYASELQMNVVCCHQHHNAIGSYKGFTVADCGCLADAKQTAYVELGVSRLPPWQPGFLLMKQGRLHPYNKHGHYGLE